MTTALVERVDFLLEARGRLNVCSTNLAKARAYAAAEFEKQGKSLDEILPDFDKNYVLIQKKCKRAQDVPRIDMPVIEPKDMKEFHKALVKGRLDIFAPYAKGKLFAPKSMTKADGEEWVTLGVKDGDPKDDLMRAKWTSVAAKDLLPTQSQIWLDKLVGSVLRFGPSKAGDPGTRVTIIVSSEGFILDGHHRFATTTLSNPKVKMKALRIPLDIKTLLKIARSYGAAIGNKPKA